VENSTGPEVCISQVQLSRLAVLCRLQAGSQGGYDLGFQAEYQTGFRVGSDNVFKCHEAFQWTLYCCNSHVENTGIHPSLATSHI
jgi:hypothetical protein